MHCVRFAESLLTMMGLQSNITRSPQEAEQIIRKHIEALGDKPSPQNFAELASVHS